MVLKVIILLKKKSFKFNIKVSKMFLVQDFCIGICNTKINKNKIIITRGLFKELFKFLLTLRL